MRTGNRLFMQAASDDNLAVFPTPVNAYENIGFTSTVVTR